MFVIAIVALLVALWFACGVVAGAAYRSHNWHEYPTLRGPKWAALDERFIRRVCIPFGAIALWVGWTEGDFKHGLMWRFPESEVTHES